VGIIARSWHASIVALQIGSSPMSLRFRLISLVCAVLCVSFGLGGAVSYSNARRSVRTEMRAALVVGRQTIENAIERLQNRRDLYELVASFDGNRHLRVRLEGGHSAAAMPTAERPVRARVPDWFVSLIGVASQTERIAVTIGARDYGTLVIETDPRNETAEVWNGLTDSLVAPAVFGGLTLVLIYVFIGRILRPLDRLAGALEEIGDGRYRTRVGGQLPPELSRLRDSFNRMAGRLAEADADNRRLNEQLLTLQEQERSDLARDLHDEVSPFLFAIDIDAATALRLLAEERSSEASGCVQSIAEAVRQIQQQVRHMLGRLRPIGLEELRLSEAIENIVAFWRRRRADIRYNVTIAAECDALPELLGTTICRIVQEALSNAVRHAEPRVITVTVNRGRNVSHDRSEIAVEVADDGRGTGEPHRFGYGLLGISERVKATGGRLTFDNRPGVGFAVTAVLPCPRTVEHNLAPAETTAP
jgi:two-component system, NarL family, sensor histidine kinase UhpB